MVAQVAALEPETAAKMVQPMMLVCSRRPGRRESQGASPLNMSSESRVRKRISPIHTKSGSAVSVHDETEPQIVTAIASPTGRVVKSSMPIQATPRSESPIQRPLPSSAKSSAISSAVMSMSIALLQPLRLVARGRLQRLAARHADQVVDQRDQQHDGAHGHGDLRDPQRRRVVALRDVVVRVRGPGEANAEERKHRAEERAGRMAPQLEGAAKPAPEAVEEERHADMLAALQGVREGEEPGCRHRIAGVRVRSAQVEPGEAPHHAGEHHQQDAHHEKRREISRGVVQLIEKLAKTHPAFGPSPLGEGSGGGHFLYASTIALPSGPAVLSHSSVMVAPTFKSALSCAEGAATVIPFDFSWSRYHLAFSSEVFQPRASASAAALRTASCDALSSASNAFRFTNTTFFGIHAWVS